MACPKCRHKIVFDYYNNDGVGKFHCVNCGHRSDDTADYTVTDVNFADRSFKFEDVSFNMPYDTPYMCYNYAGALAVAKELGDISPAEAAKAFGEFKNVGGRFEILKYKRQDNQIYENQAGKSRDLTDLYQRHGGRSGKKMVCLGLCPLIDMIPHYANSFYAFDCQLDKLVQSNVEKYFCFSDRVCYDTANRLIYEGGQVHDFHR